jgi:protein-disulfide isomerase
MSPANRSGANKALPFIIIGVVLLAVLGAGYAMINRSSSSKESLSTANANAANSTARPRKPALPGAQPPHMHGRADAPVVLEEFGDYQCPPCGAMHPVLKKIEDDYGDRVALIFRNFPLQNIHKNAFTASRAAEAAALQGKFWQMHDMIYQGQKEWSESPDPRPIFTNYASRLSLAVDKFKADLDKSEVTSRIIADFQRGDSIGVGGTPSIFLNGRELSSDIALSDAKLRAEIDAALAGKGK